MKKLIFAIPFILVACSTSEPTENKIEPTADIQEVTTEVIPEVELILQDFPEELAELEDKFTQFELPLNINQEFIDSIDGTVLSATQFQYLTQNFEPIKAYDDYYLEKSIEMYDLKKKGTYEDYTSSLDIGQLRDAEGYSFGQINLDTAIIVLWTIEYGSFEACPFYSGSELFATTIQNDSIVKCIQLADFNSGGDPPAFGETYTDVVLSEMLELKGKQIDQSFEDDKMESSDTLLIDYSLKW